MEKKCDVCGNNYKPKRKNQKNCSVKCQHESYRKAKVEKVLTLCGFCKKEFSILPNKLLNGKGKYCTRKCKDTHQKFIYSGTNNPTYGLKQSQEQRNKTSIRTKKLWQSVEYRTKQNKKVSNYVEKFGYHWGTSVESNKKRKETMIKKYGVPHNWIGEYGKRKCDVSTLQIYGETSVQMLANYNHYYNKKTDIEQLFEKLLEELKIPYQCKFRIYDKEKVKFWFKEYDFLIIDTKILIEIDGDYWHGNENFFTELSDFQKSVRINDEIKETFANDRGFEVIRFWGSDVKKNIDEVKIKIKKIWEKY
jgi:very-short-patch-repair endonuclease